MADPGTRIDTWGFPTHVRFGAGRVAELPEVVRDIGAMRPLLVTDPGLVQTGLPDRLVGILAAAGIACPVFSGVKPNPTGANVDDGVARFRDGGHDMVICLGGGSAMDAGKAVALMAGQARPIWEFEDIGDLWRRVDPAGMRPTVAIPTTAGTGSELGRASVLTNEAEARKVIIYHPDMLPRAVIDDPELTVGLPAHLTAATGMDALTHALEAYLASPGRFHPMADGIAMEAMRLIRGHLALAVADGTDLTARSAMLAAASMACVALQKGLGGVHALAHALGALYDKHHGLLNAVILPYVLRHNMAAVRDRLTRLARFLEVGADAEHVLDWVLALRAEIGIPHTLSAIGIPDDRIDAVVDLALRDPTAAANPRPLSGADVAAILRAALHGG